MMSCLCKIAKETLEEQEVIDVLGKVNSSFSNYLNSTIIGRAEREKITKAQTSADALGVIRQALMDSLVPNKLDQVIRVLRENVDGSGLHADVIEYLYREKINQHSCEKKKCDAKALATKMSDHCLSEVADETMQLPEVIKVFGKVNQSFCNHLNIDIIGSTTQEEIANAKNSDMAMGLFRRELRNSPVPDKLNQVIQVLREKAPRHAKDIEQYYNETISTHKKTCAKCKKEFGQPGGPTGSTASGVTASRSSDDCHELRRTKRQTSGYNAMPPMKRRVSEMESTAAKSTDESPKIDVNVKTVDRDKIEPLLHAKNVYKVRPRTRGRALILNIDKFDNDERNREGSSHDAKKLEHLFKKLHFDTELVQSPSKKEILDLLTDESTKSGDCDAFVLCALSHGGQSQGQDFICGRDYNWEKDCSDRNEVKITEDICEKFETDDLKEKPKIFIIQACRGVKCTKGSLLVTETTDNIGEEGQMHSDYLKKHEKADFLIAQATVPGYAAWRRPDSGSWFVKSLVEVFAEKAHSHHIQDMLKEVRRKVESKETSEEGYVQMTADYSTLTKDFYFFPGYIDPK